MPGRAQNFMAEQRAAGRRILAAVRLSVRPSGGQCPTDGGTRSCRPGGRAGKARRGPSGGWGAGRPATADGSRRGLGPWGQACGTRSDFGKGSLLVHLCSSRRDKPQTAGHGAKGLGGPRGPAPCLSLSVGGTAAVPAAAVARGAKEAEPQVLTSGCSRSVERLVLRHRRPEETSRETWSHRKGSWRCKGRGRTQATGDLAEALLTQGRGLEPVVQGRVSSCGLDTLTEWRVGPTPPFFS